MIVYISGPYSPTPTSSIENHIATARRVAIEMWEGGYTTICPHLNTAHFEKDCKCDYDAYILGDLEILARCDAVVLLPGWRESVGAQEEASFAHEHGIPVYEHPVLPEISKSEELCPIQCAEFILTVMKMYRTHVRKNSDYSANNILIPGELGVVTRIWDKVSRLLNLYGFKFSVKRTWFEPPSKPKNESIEDSFLDLANYAVIAQLLRRGKWGI